MELSYAHELISGLKLICSYIRLSLKSTFAHLMILRLWFVLLLWTQQSSIEDTYTYIFVPSTPRLASHSVLKYDDTFVLADEIQRQLQMSEAKVVITLPEAVKVIKDALNLAKLDIPIIVVKTNGNPTPDGTACFNELSEDQHVDTSVLKKVRRNGSDICFLPYSSGTTGLPKGVELSHRNIIANGEQVNEEDVRCHNETTGELFTQSHHLTGHLATTAVTTSRLAIVRQRCRSPRHDKVFA